MPRIVRKELPEVQPNVLPRPLAGQSLADAASRPSRILAAGVTRIASDVQQISALRARKASATVRLKSTNELREKMTKLELGKNGFLSQRGEFALDGDKTANTELAKEIDEIAGRMTEADAARWRPEIGAMADSFRRRSMTHSFNEQEKLAVAEFQVDQQGSIQDALKALASFPADEDGQGRALEAFGEALGSYREILTARAKELGWTDKIVNDLMEQWTSTAIKAGVDTLIKQDSALVAKELFSELEDKMRQDDVNDIKERLAPATDRALAMRKMDAVFQGEDTLDAELIGKVNKAINDEDDPIHRAIMETERRRRFASMREERAAVNGERFMALWNGPLDDPTKMDESEGWGDFDEDEQAALRQEAFIRSLGGHRPPQSDGSRRYRLWDVEFLKDEEGNDTAEFIPRTADYKAGFNLLKLRPFLTESDFNSLVREQNSIRDAQQRGSKTGPSAFGNAITRMHQDLLPQMEQTLGIELTDGQRGILNQNIREAVEDLTHDPERKGRPINRDEMKKLLSDVLVGEFTDKGFEFSTVERTRFFNKEFPTFMARMFELSSESSIFPTEPLTEQEDRLVNDFLGSRLGRKPSHNEVKNAMAQQDIGNDPELRDFMEANIELEAANREKTLEEGLERASEVVDIPDVLLDDLRREVKLSGRDPTDPLVLSEAWKTVRDSFQQAQIALGGDRSIYADSKDLDDARMLAGQSAAWLMQLRQSGKSDSEAREMLNMVLPLDPFQIPSTPNVKLEDQ